VKLDKKTLVTAITFLLIGTILTSVVWVYASPSVKPMYLSGGIYPQASYTIWKEDSTYYAKNAYGALKYENTNLTTLLNSVVNDLDWVDVTLCAGSSVILAPTGHIHFVKGKYYLPKLWVIPLGARIKITGDGYAMQAVDVGKEGGTQIYSNDPDGILVARSSGTLKNSSSITTQGTMLILRDIEFIQNVQQTNSSCSSVWLNGMSNGALDSVMVTAYKGLDYQLQGIGLRFETVDGLGDQVTWHNVQVSGFTTQVQLAPDHISIDGLGLSGGVTGLKVAHMARGDFRDIHFFALHTCIDVIAGSLLEVMYMRSVYVEDTGYGAINFKDNNLGKKIVLERVFCAGNQANLWTFTNATRWEFHNVVVSSPSFPSTDTPSIQNNVEIYNTNPCMVEVAVHANDAPSFGIVINGDGFGDFTKDGTFILYAGDIIKVNWASGTPAWAWRQLDV